MSLFEEWEVRLIRALSRPLPLTPRPYAAVAESVGISEEQVIERVRAWCADGTIRRFGARVRHRRLGYTANGMSVWDVPDERTDAVGAVMAGHAEVSHCYVRPRRPGWPYNMYAMVHGQTREEVDDVVARIASATGLSDYRVLFSVRELKKSAPRYFAEGLERTDADAT